MAYHSLVRAVFPHHLLPHQYLDSCQQHGSVRFLLPSCWRRGLGNETKRRNNNVLQCQKYLLQRSGTLASHLCQTRLSHHLIWSLWSCTTELLRYKLSVQTSGVAPSVLRFSFPWFFATESQKSEHMLSWLRQECRDKLFRFLQSCSWKSTPPAEI